MKEVFEKARSILSSLDNEALARKREQGKKVVGYPCSYVPEEVLIAAGLVPHRLRVIAGRGTVKADTYYGPLNCSFVRRIFDQVLGGEYAFLSGVVLANGCDHARRMYDNWLDARAHSGIGPDFIHPFISPHVTTGNAVSRYIGEVRKLISALEAQFSVKISVDSLFGAVNLVNKRRELLQKLEKKRRGPVPALRTSQWISLAQAAASLPVEDAVSFLEEALDRVEGVDAGVAGFVRVMLAGGCADELTHLELLEECSVHVVADSTCLGERFADCPVRSDGDPVEAIARRYMEHLPCPRMIDAFPARTAHVEDAIRERGVEGFVCAKLMFCDLWGGEGFMLKKLCQEKDIPFLQTEREVGGEGLGQLKTRVQAFVETVSNRRKSAPGNGQRAAGF
jgi:benzoyl-CoA reductase/2-hydroxyglutaryl-CoA dehydratase subunit BcrC/BadD/HgdB